MNHRHILAAATMVLAPLAASAEVNLLGDTLSFKRAWPNVATQYLSAIPDTTVAAGPGDRVSWIVLGGVNYTTFDPEAHSIQVIFNVASGYGGGGSIFDGYVVSGFDHDIQSFSVTQTAGFAVTPFLLDPRTLAINLSGTRSGTISIDIGLAQPVPEPTSVAMMAAGLGLLAMARRRKQQG